MAPNESPHEPPFCDICWLRPKKQGMRFFQCQTCGVGVHDECYGIMGEAPDPFECWACKAVGTRSSVRKRTSSGKRQSFKTKERPTECCLCGVDDGTEWYHAMHPVYDRHGSTGRQIVLSPTRKKPQYRLAWAHTLCCFAINSHSRTAGCVYGCTIDGGFDGEDDDNSDNSSVNSDLLQTDTAHKDKTIHHFVYCLPGKLNKTNAWTDCIHNQQQLKCYVCGLDDTRSSSLRIPIQCSANDENEYKEFKGLHEELGHDDCYVSMHVGCSIWGRNIAGELPRCRKVYYFPGIDGSIQQDTVINMFCDVHAQDLLKVKTIGADKLKYPSHLKQVKRRPSQERRPSRLSSVTERDRVAHEVAIRSQARFHDAEKVASGLAGSAKARLGLRIATDKRLVSARDTRQQSIKDTANALPVSPRQRFDKKFPAASAKRPPSAKEKSELALVVASGQEPRELKLHTASAKQKKQKDKSDILPASLRRPPPPGSPRHPRSRVIRPNPSESQVLRPQGIEKAQAKKKFRREMLSDLIKTKASFRNITCAAAVKAKASCRECWRRKASDTKMMTSFEFQDFWTKLWTIASSTAETAKPMDSADRTKNTVAATKGPRKECGHAVVPQKKPTAVDTVVNLSVANTTATRTSRDAVDSSKNSTTTVDSNSTRIEGVSSVPKKKATSEEDVTGADLMARSRAVTAKVPVDLTKATAGARKRARPEGEQSDVPRKKPASDGTSSYVSAATNANTNATTPSQRMADASKDTTATRKRAQIEASSDDPQKKPASNGARASLRAARAKSTATRTCKNSADISKGTTASSKRARNAYSLNDSKKKTAFNGMSANQSATNATATVTRNSKDAADISKDTPTARKISRNEGAHCNAPEKKAMRDSMTKEKQVDGQLPLVSNDASFERSLREKILDDIRENGQLSTVIDDSILRKAKARWKPKVDSKVFPSLWSSVLQDFNKKANAGPAASEDHGTPRGLLDDFTEWDTIEVIRIVHAGKLNL